MDIQLLSPQAPRFIRSDSLVFSITAEKDDSPHDTDLLKDSFTNQASKDISYLNNKLDALENRVKSIKTQQVENLNHARDQNQNIDITNLTLGQDSFKAGRFHKKCIIKHANQISNNNSSFNVTVRNNRSYSRDSKASNHSHKSQIMQRDSHIKSLRKQMIKLRMKVQKSDRSKSKCSQKLSLSKQNIKVLKSQKNAQQKLIANLVKDLKKSENIRKKQKQTIAKQKKQIDELKNLLITYKSQLRA